MVTLPVHGSVPQYNGTCVDNFFGWSLMSDYDTFEVENSFVLFKPQQPPLIFRKNKGAPH
jgi:hypothetical protein